MLKIRNKIIAHRTFLILFACLLLYEFCVVGRFRPWNIDPVVYSMYALDFSFGFTDKILPGAFYGLFFKELSEKNVLLFSFILLVLFFGLVSYLLEKVYLSADKKDRPMYALLFALFLTGPATFSVFVAEPGIIEVFWYYLAALFFVLISHRGAPAFAVLLCFAALLVNLSAIMVVVPMFCILLLYKLSLETDKREKKVLLASFIVCVCVSIPFFIYLVVFAKNDLPYTGSEFWDIMTKKGVSPEYPGYFFYPKDRQIVKEYAKHFIGNTGSDEFIAAHSEYISGAGLRDLFNYFVFQAKATRMVGGTVHKYLSELLFLSPPLLCALVFFVRRFFDRNEQPLRRFVFFCVPVLFLLDLLSGFLFSVDTGKWIAYSTIVLFSVFLYVCCMEREKTTAYLKDCLRLCPPAAAVCYALIYAFTLFSVY